MSKLGDWYKENASALMTGVAISGWSDILFGGLLDLNFHHHNMVGGLSSFAIVGLLAIPRTLLRDRLKEEDKTTNQIEVDHKPCCDCEDDQLHEEALAEIDNYLNSK